jgi:hypothetical protein
MANTANAALPGATGTITRHIFHRFTYALPTTNDV